MSKRVRINIDRILEKNDLTQAELKEKTGVRQAAISQLSRGFVSRISIDHIERIANALEIDDISEIISLEDSEE